MSEYREIRVEKNRCPSEHQYAHRQRHPGVGVKSVKTRESIALSLTLVSISKETRL